MASRTSVPYAPGGPPNKQQYPFFVDDQMNKVIPPWFVSCEREEAVKKLNRRYPDANVYLMRPSKTSGYFALTVQTIVTGYKRAMNHYSVVFHRASGTFRIEIDKPHAPTKTLSEIMELFTKLNKPIIYCIYGLGTSAPTSPASPPTLNGTSPFSKFPLMEPSSADATSLTRNTSNASGHHTIASDYISTNVDELTCQLTAVVLPTTQRGPDVIQRPTPPYLELLNDYAANSSGMEGEYLTTNNNYPENSSGMEGEYLTTNDNYPENSSGMEGEYLTTNDSDQREENRFGSVGSPSTNTAQTPDGYVVLLDDDDDMAPLEKAPPPPVSRKAFANSVSQRTATGSSASSHDYVQPIADDDDYVAPQVALSVPPIPSAPSRSAAQINYHKATKSTR